MKKAGMIALLAATLGIGALGMACGDSKPAANPDNPAGSSTGTGTGAATSSGSAAPAAT